MLSRRSFLRSGLVTGGTLAFGAAFWRDALAATPATPGRGPYGELTPFDEQGIALPPGFRSRKIAQGRRPVAGYTWHIDTDGQGCFPTPDGGWILTANSEAGPEEGGGASMVRFDREGTIVEARRILGGTDNNCAGGATPWGTWLSCEEEFYGQVWECDPTGVRPAVARPAMGVFTHEAVCVDPIEQRLYMTEDERDGCFYRFTPDAYPDLSAGTLEVLVEGADGAVTWAAVSPLPTPPTRYQGALLGAKAFAGGEGIWFDSGNVYFTTKGDVRVWVYDTRAKRIEILYDRATAGDGTPLRSVDNITVSQSGDVYVCEDGDNFEISMISRERRVQTFARLDPAVHGEPGSNETTGVVFDPSGTRMYFGAQRSFGAGAVYEISGPFRTLEQATDTRSPGARLTVARRIARADLERRGLPVTLVLTEPAAVRATLYARGGRQLARFDSGVVVRDRVAIRLKPGAAPKQANVGELVIRLRDAAGNRRVLRRRVRIG